MSLAIYTDADPSTALSEDGAHTNDFTVSLNGKTGGVTQRKLYIRNDDSLRSYTDIELIATSPTTGSIYTDDSLGYSWKLSEGTDQPVDDEWELIDAGDNIDIPDIGTESLSDTSTYAPFWVRIKIPRNVSVHTFTDIQFQITATEILV